MAKPIKIKIKRQQQKPAQHISIINKHIISWNSKLQDLKDVEISTLDDWHILKYDATSWKWINKPITSAWGATKFTELEDTPSNYSWYWGKVLVVKSTEDWIDFVDINTTDEKVALKAGTTPDYLENLIDWTTIKSDWTKIYTDGSVLDVDKVDWYDASDFALATHAHTISDISDFPQPSVANTYLKYDGNWLVWASIDSWPVNNLYKQVSYTGVSVWDSKTIILENANPTYNRQVFVLQKQILDALDVYPFDFTENEFQFDNINVLINWSIELKTKEFLNLQDENIYKISYINIDNYKDIIGFRI